MTALIYATLTLLIITCLLAITKYGIEIYELKKRMKLLQILTKKAEGEE